MRYSLLILLFIFSRPLLSQELIEFENGEVADANDINSNFAKIASELNTLREDLSFSTEGGIRAISIDCDVEGRTALSNAILQNLSIASNVQINVSGACSAINIPGGKFTIVGSPSFSINQAEEDAQSAFLIEVLPQGTLTLVSATIDASGSDFAVRNLGTAILAFTTIKNASRANFETFGTTYAIGAVTLGDEDDVATACLVASGGVLVNYFPSGVFPPEFTEAPLILRGIDQVLVVRDAGFAGLALPDTRLNANGGSILIERGGNLTLAEAAIQLSDAFYIQSNANVTVKERIDRSTTISLHTDLLLSQGGTLGIDLSNEEQSVITHTGNLRAQLGSSISIIGSPNSVSDVNLGLTPEGAEEAVKFSIDTESQLRIEHGVIHSTVNLRSATMWLDDEATLSQGVNAITSSFGARVMVDGDVPSAEVNCLSNGQAWAVNNGISLCGN